MSFMIFDQGLWEFVPVNPGFMPDWVTDIELQLVRLLLGAFNISTHLPSKKEIELRINIISQCLYKKVFMPKS